MWQSLGASRNVWEVADKPISPGRLNRASAHAAAALASCSQSGGDTAMSIPRASTIQAALRLLVPAVAVGGIPPISNAGEPGQQRSLADKFRYGPGVTNHPVGIVPSAAVRIPSSWPLDADGTITCLTCHRRLPPWQGATSAYLRDFDGEQDDWSGFCAKCHAADGQRTAAATHWMAVRVAHVKGDATRSPRSTASLDAQSRRCMGCHDGVSASDADNTTPWNRGRGYVGDRRRNHPVGVRYPNRTPRKFGVRFRPAALVPKQVRLPGGKVSCVSCHDLYAKSRSLLTVPIERSALCFACHDLD